MTSYVTAEQLDHGDVIYPDRFDTAHTVTGLHRTASSDVLIRIYTDRTGREPFVCEPDDMIRIRR